MESLTRALERILDTSLVDRLLAIALEEDIGPGDVTTELTVPADCDARARMVAKAEGVVCGLPVLERLRTLAGARFGIEPRCAEGGRVRPGDVLAVLSGRARDILGMERVMLNVIQRTSGIATATRRYVDAVGERDCAVLETRKTVPGWRSLDKYAVLAGGGRNHRAGLFDQILAKENHFALAALGGGPREFRRAVSELTDRAPAGMIVEVEVETLAQLEVIVDIGVDIVLLDDMTIEEMRQAVELRDARGAGRPLLEASGGITLDDVPSVAATGVDRISIGALTHSVQALDISLLIDT